MKVAVVRRGPCRDGLVRPERPGGTALAAGKELRTAGRRDGPAAFDLASGLGLSREFHRG